MFVSFGATLARVPAQPRTQARARALSSMSAVTAFTDAARGELSGSSASLRVRRSTLPPRPTLAWGGASAQPRRHARGAPPQALRQASTRSYDSVHERHRLIQASACSATMPISAVSHSCKWRWDDLARHGHALAARHQELVGARSGSAVLKESCARFFRLRDRDGHRTGSGASSSGRDEDGARSACGTSGGSDGW